MYFINNQMTDMQSVDWAGSMKGSGTMKWFQHIFLRDIESLSYGHEDSALEIYQKIEHIK